MMVYFLFHSSTEQQRLIQLEETAKAAGKGKFAEDAGSRVRDITWVIENPRHFVDSHHSKPIDGKLTFILVDT